MKKTDLEVEQKKDYQELLLRWKQLLRVESNDGEDLSKPWLDMMEVCKHIKELCESLQEIEPEGN